MSTSDGSSDHPQGRSDEPFAPADPGDGRERWEYATRWPRVAWYQIIAEFAYLIVVSIVAWTGVLWTWNGGLSDLLSLEASQSPTVVNYTIAFLAGGLGGAAFSLKWLYHSVARGRWHRDRVLWRLSTPCISAALAPVLLALIRSELIQLVNPDPISSNQGVMAFAFLCGYFSDNVIGSMLRFAERVFGDRASEERDPNV